MKTKHCAFHEKNLTPTVKLDGGNVMVWGCFATSGTGHLAIIEGTMNCALYQKSLQENVKQLVMNQINSKRVKQQDNAYLRMA